MVPAHVFTDAIKKLPEWDNNPNRFSSVDTVDWRSGFQIVMMWRGNATFQCYLDFGKDHAARDAVMRAAFEQHAPAGKKPKRIACHGYSCLEHEFDSPEILTVNQIAEIAEGLGYKFTVLYVQSCSASRPLFDDLGIPLSIGEMGKEWKDGAFIPYSTPMGKNL